jgi:hypothetical protein
MTACRFESSRRRALGVARVGDDFLSWSGSRPIDDIEIRSVPRGCFVPGGFKLRVFLSVVFVLGILIGPAPALARVWVKVDLSQQRMLVFVKGRLRHKWRVSTGRGRYRTPTGNYRPTRLERDYYSRKYNNSPMPHSIFFHAGYAIHGTDYVRQLGRPASHGCVRLSRRNAARLFGIVKRYGARRVKIAIRR